MFGGAFAASANQVPVAIDSSKVMDATLKEIFAAQRTILDGTLELAVGGGGDYASLPDQVCHTFDKLLQAFLANTTI